MIRGTAFMTLSIDKANATLASDNGEYSMSRIYMGAIGLLLCDTKLEHLIIDVGDAVMRLCRYAVMPLFRYAVMPLCRQCGTLHRGTAK
jgi:hypothetical protein